MSDILLRVRSVTYQAEDINAYELVDAEGGELAPFTAGAHIDVHLPGGFVRQYSLCNDARERYRYVIAVLRETIGRGGSHAMHQSVHAGDMLRVSAPRNTFPLDERAPRSILVAGGIGVTPLLSMVARLREIGRDFVLHYCTNTAASAAFRTELAAEAAGHVVFHHSRAATATRLDVTALLSDYRPGTHIYCCGPQGLILAVKAATTTWPPDAVHFEYFSAGAAADPTTDAEFSIKLVSSGAVYPVPKDKTILAVLREHGVVIESSCEAGICGTCRTRYLEANRIIGTTISWRTSKASS